MAVITLTTDFGLIDGYVGIMKGVIQGICPGAVVIDITHDIPPQDILSAAFLLHVSYPYFPKDTVHVAVVDPGVGTERRAVALRTSNAFFVAPDNGLLSFIIEDEKVEEAVNLNNPRYRLPKVSATFHGRDIFAPAGAYLAKGVPLKELGQPIDVEDLITFPIPKAHREADEITAQILHVDRFGNLTVNLPMERVREKGEELVMIRLPDEAHPLRLHPQSLKIHIGGYEISGVRRTYAEGNLGEPMTLIGSAGYLEVAIPGDSAAKRMKMKVGDEIKVRIDRGC